MNFILNKSYPFKVWVVTILVGPYLGLFLNLMREPGRFDISILYVPLFLAILYAFTSLPAFALYYLLFHFFGRILKSEVLLKIILCLFSCAIIISMFIICDMEVMLRRSNKDGFLFFQGILYSTLASGILFKSYASKAQTIS
jgi:hypothetical protein